MQRPNMSRGRYVTMAILFTMFHGIVQGFLSPANFFQQQEMNSFFASSPHSQSIFPIHQIKMGSSHDSFGELSARGERNSATSAVTRFPRRMEV